MSLMSLLHTRLVALQVSVVLVVALLSGCAPSLGCTMTSRRGALRAPAASQFRRLGLGARIFLR
ncbi:hypothetical protein BDV25DRAFT_148810 [Aspergillus avenaceus]|uniref:Uncharacterized protein n=1 Tax=Aspergillus avenaceus TaxID=36643 RepID=A0A5N6U575_ASPAV|nr:hypothetical protein BDV25DRAFT_148810 [Aspergillus avenaceus]